MNNRLIRRQHRNRGRASPAEPAVGDLPVIPREIARYVLRLPPAFGWVITSSSNKPTVMDKAIAFGSVVLANGWSMPEAWGVWSDGPLATIYLGNPWLHPAAHRNEVAAELVLRIRGAVFERDPTRLAVCFICAGGRSEVSFSWGQESEAEVVVTVPSAALVQQVLRLDVNIDAPRSAFERTGGMSTDKRMIGIGLRAIEFRSPKDVDAVGTRATPEKRPTSPAG